MEKTLQEKIEMARKVTEKMIAEMDAKLQQAIKREDWAKAADIDSYVSGMRQIQVVIEQLFN
jgi:protein-arginine kinase activator protein McsA